MYQMYHIVIDEPDCLLWALGGTPANARAEKFSSLLNGSESMCMVQSRVPVFEFAVLRPDT